MAGGVIEISEEYRDKQETAEFFCISKRSLERAMSQGLPHRHIFGRVAFKAETEVEPWLEEHGYIERRGEAA